MSDPTPPPTHLGRLLRDAQDAWSARLRQAYTAAGLGTPRVRFDPILRHVGEEPEPVRALFERSRLSRRGFTEQVEELERLGLVERFDDPADPRVKHLRYTALGLDLYRRAREVMFALEAEFAADLGAERLAELHAALQGFIDSQRPRP